MKSSWTGWRDFMKEISVRIGGAGGALALIFLLFWIGDRFDIRFLQSQGGILVSTIILGELIFFILIGLMVFRD